MLIAGVDDAGRGPAIGPLVIAGVTFLESQMPKLRLLGVKDSKVLSSKRRAILSYEVKRLAVKWEVVELEPSKVDEIVLNGWKLHKLNWLEAMTMAEIIRRLHPDAAYVDASDIIQERFGSQIKETLPFKVNVVSEHHADANYVVVSAASIVAKVHRDDAIALLRKKYGDFGSGYPNDPRRNNSYRPAPKIENFQIALESRGKRLNGLCED